LWLVGIWWKINSKRNATWRCHRLKQITQKKLEKKKQKQTTFSRVLKLLSPKRVIIINPNPYQFPNTTPKTQTFTFYFSLAKAWLWIYIQPFGIVIVLFFSSVKIADLVHMWFFIHLVLKSGRYYFMFTCRCKIFHFLRSRGKNAFLAPTSCDLHRFCFTLCKVHGWRTFPKCKVGIEYCFVLCSLFGEHFHVGGLHET
jgi:hypothetical protein